MKHKYDSSQEIGIENPPDNPYYLLVQFFKRAAQLSLFYNRLLVENKILDGMTRPIIWNRENVHWMLGYD